MLDIVCIPCKIYSLILMSIPPSESHHDDISDETSEHHQDEYLHMRSGFSREKYESRKEYKYKRSYFTASIRNKAKLRTESCLEVTHERAIDESREGKK